MIDIEYSVLISGLAAALAITLSTWLIFQHQSNFVKPYIQSKIVGILWMVPIYSTCSFLSLISPGTSLYLDLIRDCYEAYVLYLFLALMLAYIGGCDDEYTIIMYMESIPHQIFYPFPFSLCWKSPLPSGRSFLRHCKFGVMQFCVVRTFCAVIAVILDLMDLLHKSDFSLEYGFIYLTGLANVSTAYAFLTLAIFFYAMKDKLKPYDPVPKFLCIKLIIFFVFWQGVFIAVSVRLGLISDIGPYSAETLANSLQDFLICLEMLLFAVLHTFAFSHRPFLDVKYTKEDTFHASSPYALLQESSPSSHVSIDPYSQNIVSAQPSGVRGMLMKIASFAAVKVNFDRHFAHKTALRDFNDAMPLLLPTDFTPKRGVTVASYPEDRVHKSGGEGKRYQTEDFHLLRDSHAAPPALTGRIDSSSPVYNNYVTQLGPAIGKLASSPKSHPSVAVAIDENSKSINSSYVPMIGIDSEPKDKLVTNDLLFKMEDGFEF